MIEINQDTLCDYCTKVFDNNSRDLCEGKNCDSANERYLEEFGITEDKKSFRTLNLGDTVYQIKINEVIPRLYLHKVELLKTQVRGSLLVRFDLGSDVNVEYPNAPREGEYFMEKEEAEAELEKVCTERIVQLAKVIGSINKTKERDDVRGD